MKTPATPDSFILAGAVLPMTSPGNRAEAVAVRGDTIVAVGDLREVRAELGPDVPVIDHGGRAILPAFIDAHHHFSLAAYDAQAPDLHLPVGATLGDLLARVEAYADADDTHGWLRIQGYDVHKLRDRRLPTRTELDAICPDRPLLLIAYSFHEGILNSAGLDRLGWNERTQDPANGWLSRRRGRLTGEVGESAFFLAEALSRANLDASRDEQWLLASEEHGRDLLRAGITRVGDPAVSPEFDRLYELAAATDRLPVTVHRFPVSSRSILTASFERGPTGSGPRRAPVGPAKLILDGADRCAVCLTPGQVLRSGPAAVRRSLRLRRAAPIRTMLELGRGGSLSRRGMQTGLLFHQADETAQLIHRARERGLQVAQHAIGNRAVDVALSALEATEGSADGALGPSRIEHFFLVGPDHVRRARGVGAVAVVQPVWLTDMATRMENQVVPRPLSILPLRSMLDAGVPAAASSDYPVAGYDVMAGIQAAVTRTSPAGFVLEPDERVTVQDALAMYTSAAAASLGVAHRVGRLEAGMGADLVVLSADPTAVEPAALTDIVVEQTYLEGVPRL